jgi:hypothetical protein
VRAGGGLTRGNDFAEFPFGGRGLHRASPLSSRLSNQASRIQRRLPRPHGSHDSDPQGHFRSTQCPWPSSPGPRALQRLLRKTHPQPEKGPQVCPQGQENRSKTSHPRPCQPGPKVATPASPPIIHARLIFQVPGNCLVFGRAGVESECVVKIRRHSSEETASRYTTASQGRSTCRDIGRIVAAERGRLADAT